jgi:hypothetical protein
MQTKTPEKKMAGVDFYGTDENIVLTLASYYTPPPMPRMITEECNQGILNGEVSLYQ